MEQVNYEFHNSEKAENKNEPSVKNENVTSTNLTSPLKNFTEANSEKTNNTDPKGEKKEEFRDEFRDEFREEFKEEFKEDENDPLRQLLGDDDFS